MAKGKANLVLGGMFALLASTAVIADSAIDEGKELCKKLQSSGNKNGVSKSNFHENLAKIRRPAGELLATDVSAGLYLAIYGDGQKLRWLTWRTLKPVIDGIYDGKIKFKVSRFDINNDGKDERVLIYSGEYPFNDESAYVVDENNLPDAGFKNELGRPVIVNGISVIFRNHTYQMDYRHESSVDTSDLTSVVLYKPSALNSAPRIIPLGAGPVCKIKII